MLPETGDGGWTGFVVVEIARGRTLRDVKIGEKQVNRILHRDTCFAGGAILSTGTC